MEAISVRDFRQNMKAVLDTASRGEDVILSRGDEYFMVVKVDMNMRPTMPIDWKERVAAVRENLKKPNSVMSMTFDERIDLGTTDYKELLANAIEENNL